MTDSPPRGPSATRLDGEGAEQMLRRRVKAELRKRMRGLRNTMPSEAGAERSARIVQTLSGHAWLVAARSVALFWPMQDRHEVDLRALDANLRQRGVRIAYPAINEEGAMAFHWVKEPLAMQERGHMFAEPGAEDPLVGTDGIDISEIDVALVPAISVDPAGHRIGYGAGYYDRALAKLGPAARTIAVAFDYQLISEVPVTAGDVAVRLVVTDSRVIEAGAPQ